MARVVRNVGRRSNIGFIATERQGERGNDNRVVGIDANINPTNRFGIRGFFSHSSDDQPSENPGAAPASSRTGHSLGISSTYDADAWGLGIETLEVDQDYEPRMGFLLRRDFRFVKPKLSIRPRIEKFGIRNLRMGYAFKHTSQRSTGIMESRAFEGDLIGFETFGGSSFYLWADVITERLFEPFEIRPGVVIDRGRYDFDPTWNFFYWSPRQRRLSVQLNGARGGFFDGDQESLSAELRYRPEQVLPARLESFQDRHRPARRLLHHRDHQTAHIPQLFTQPASGRSGSAQRRGRGARSQSPLQLDLSPRRRPLHRLQQTVAGHLVLEPGSHG